MDTSDELTFDQALRSAGTAHPLDEQDAQRLYAAVLYLIDTTGRNPADEHTARVRAHARAAELIAERRDG